MFVSLPGTGRSFKPCDSVWDSLHNKKTEEPGTGQDHKLGAVKPSDSMAYLCRRAAGGHGIWSLRVTDP